MTDLDLAYRSAVELADLVATGQLSPVELVANSLDRMGEVQPILNAFTEVHADAALADAAVAADMVARKEPLGRLHGVPVAIKDTTPQAGRRTTLGSYTHEDWVPDHNAQVVSSLSRAGAIRVATTTAPEFAYNLLTDSPLWGPTRNPWNVERSPGGSSGGSAVAVATGCVALAEGTDMGGSVRIPASWTGLVGLKPGLGRIPMSGLPGLFDSISHHGPLARSVNDARLFLAATQNPSDADIMSVVAPLDLRGSTPESIDGWRIAYSPDLGCWEVDSEIAAAVKDAVGRLEAQGAIVTEVDPGITVEFEEAWMKLWGVFMASYYGHLVDEYNHVMDPQVLKLIELGNGLSAVDYKRLELQRSAMWRRIASVLANHRVLICPTMAQPPWPASSFDSPSAQVVDGRATSPEMTAVFNMVAPCPALSVPCGWHPQGSPHQGLPIGLQIVGPRWRSDLVLQAARAVESSSPKVGGRRTPV